MERREQLRQLLEEGKYFKMVCGAGNEDTIEVKRLAFLYTMAGAKGLDVAANTEVVRSMVDGIDLAFEMAPSLGVALSVRPFIMVSVGMKGDHHVRKACITEECIQCRQCENVCPTKAIESTNDKVSIVATKCIGCGNCSAVCPISTAINYAYNGAILMYILPACLAAGAENIELHAAIGDNDQIMLEWEVVNEANPYNYNSMCLDRLHLGNYQLENRIESARAIAGDWFMIQADGYPMSGGVDDFNTTLQAVATADVINKSFNKKLDWQTKKLVNKDKREIDIIISGGTNNQTASLSSQCGVGWQGIAIGSYARKLVYDVIKKHSLDDDFYSDIDNIKIGCLLAKSLVDTAIGE